jgi:hypothetical protein
MDISKMRTTVFGKFSLFATLILCANQLWASEAASSVYIPGTYGDFMVASIPSSGFYLRDDSVFYQGNTSQAEFSGQIQNYPKLKFYMNLLQAAYFTDCYFLGGRYGVGVRVPYIYSGLDTTVTFNGTELSNSARTIGLGDLYTMPIMLSWTNANYPISALFYEGIVVPTGHYSVANLMNVGRNYTAFDSNVALTWLSKSGQEISSTIGYIINTTNTSTHYRTGNELHIDLLAAQHLTSNLGLGIAGYYYRQINSDSGSGTLLGGFKSYSLGVGPAVSWSIPLTKDKPLNIIGKFLHDFSATNRFKGNEVMVSLAAQL